ncbi:MAG: mannose-1-phosphate guanylyltransferase [Spirochaetales bacterium]
MTNLILCGGSGTRLWPLSRPEMPKQFYPLFAGRSLFEMTVDRNKALADHFYVASNQLQMGLATAQLAKCGVTKFGSLVEPVGRNTAPAIALACMALVATGKADELVLVTPSDHLMTKPADYERAVKRAGELAAQGYLVTFGIAPTYAETGFGYIEARGEDVVSFREKPDQATAEGYLRSGKHFWNSGMFVFRAGVFLAELQKHSPEVYRTCAAVTSVTREAMMAIPAISIDYAVMEKTALAKVVASDPGWSDLGSFDALYDEVVPRTDGNRVLGAGEPVFVESSGNLVVTSGRQVALVGVTDLLVVDSPHGLLVARRGASQSVKEVSSRLQSSGSSNA